MFETSIFRNSTLNKIVIGEFSQQKSFWNELWQNLLLLSALNRKTYIKQGEKTFTIFFQDTKCHMREVGREFVKVSHDIFPKFLSYIFRSTTYYRTNDYRVKPPVRMHIYLEHIRLVIGKVKSTRYRSLYKYSKGGKTIWLLILAPLQTGIRLVRLG